MENASKALIIAGAILLSILIIGLGMFIYQQASGAMAGANLDPQKANAYNQEFLNYEGTQTGSNTKALYKLIENHNRTYTDDVSQQIQINNGEAPATTEEAEASISHAWALSGANSLRTSDTYKISFSYNKSGYITHCYINRVQ